MRYVDVVLDLKSEYTDTLFTYAAPDEIRVGDKVTVPFGTRRRPVDGYVAAVDTVPAVDVSRVREVLTVDTKRSLTAEMMETAAWMVHRYGVKRIDAVRLFTVAGKRERGERTFTAADQTAPAYELSAEQQEAARRIIGAVHSHRSHAFLIKGVTNSGKTEVYMQAVREALAMGRTAIVLVPEIALAAQTERRFKERFGEDAVAVLHSKLTTSAKLEEWRKLRDGTARIAVGARTAVFAPLDNIGVIVIDEEHETTYKSDHNPKFETVDVAYKRAQAHDAVLVLGSATPSIVSYERACTGIYELIEMNERVGPSRMPRVEIVDMGNEVRSGNTTLISGPLRDAVAETLSRGEQVILFLNRRGFSTQVVCPDCGERILCEDCGIALTYHKSENAMVCHYCGRHRPVPAKCPACGFAPLKFVGAGTEKIEETIAGLFPDATVARFDLDTAKSQREIDRVISSFTSGRTDILVGTQILAKGLDFRNVGLVGVIMADITLNLPDYRASERAFQLITQVSGRAGRTSGDSRVLIQTYVPDDAVIRAAAEGDYEGFFSDESLHRKIMNYPPYSDIIAVSFIDKKGSDNDPSVVMKYAKDFRRRLLAMREAPRDAVLFEPREDVIKSGRDRNRVTFLIKAPKGSRAGYVKAYADYRDSMMSVKAPCHIEIDINPY